MLRAIGIIVLIALMGTSCVQDEGAQDFFEKMPKERLSRIVNQNLNAVKSKSARGMKYGTGSHRSRGKTIINDRQNATEQMLIKKATLRFQVKDYNQARISIANIIENSNAYISSERETKTDNKISNHLEIRVITSQFETVIDSLTGQSKNLDEKNISVKDVTEEFVDLKARLKAKHEVEMRYLDILERAQTVEDILRVEQKLGEIREEIEAKEGRLNYLSHQVSYSTINLFVYEKMTVMPKSRVGFFRRLAVSFLHGWRGLTEYLLALVGIWPFLLIMIGIIYVIYKIIKKIKAHVGARGFEIEEK